MHKTIRNMLGMTAAAGLFTAAFAGAANAGALTLINGWTNAAFGSAKASAWVENGIVHLKGGIATSGTNAEPFVLPGGYIPSSIVYVPVDLCNAAKGRLVIDTSGNVVVQAEGGTFSNAQCFTSLDGVTFALSPASYKPMILRHKWTTTVYGTAAPAARNIGGVVHFQGAISTSGTNTEPFVLPAAFRPSVPAYVPVDLCGATNGRLIVSPSGAVTVEAETSFGNAQCFTSLEGASFALNSSGTTALTLINGWTNAAFGTGNAAVRLTKDIVQFQGGIATSGTNAEPFVLPVGFRPSKNVWINVDLCNATKGRLQIDTSGNVFVEAEGGTFSNAQCFTSLEGASFHL